MKKFIVIFISVLFVLVSGAPRAEARGFLRRIKAALSISRDQWTDHLKIPDFIQWYPPDALTSPIYGDKIVKQNFKPNFDGLTELGLRFDWEKYPADILVSLYEGENQERLIFEREFSLNDIYKTEMLRFRFRPIRPSKDKYFSLVIAAPKLNADNNLRLYYHRRTLHVSCRGQLYFDDQNKAGELSLIANYRYDITKGIFTWAKKKMLCDKLFFLSYAIVLFLISGAAVLYRSS